MLLSFIASLGPIFTYREKDKTCHCLFCKLWTSLALLHSVCMADIPEELSGSHFSRPTRNRTFFFRNECVYPKLLKIRPCGLFFFFFQAQACNNAVRRQRIHVALPLVVGHVLLWLSSPAFFSTPRPFCVIKMKL